VACDEICGIFYAYHKLNPIPFGEMKVSSINKRLKESRFAPGINREHILKSCEDLSMSTEDHIAHLIKAFEDLPLPEEV